MEPTNLLYILSDQHNRDVSGCYGHPLIQTPHLDGLAERGTRFNAAYTNCPICVPARASLATGQFVHRIGYWDNAFPYDGAVPGWGHRLIEAGHQVDSIGKLHYRSADDADGFSNHVIPLNVVDGIGDVMGAIRDVPPIRNGARDGVLGAGPGSSTYLDYDERIADASMEWLRARANEPQDKPWVMFASFVCPHPPYVAPQELFDLYPQDQITLPPQCIGNERVDHPVYREFRRVMQWEESFREEEIRRMHAAYFGCITHLDRQIGKLLAALKQSPFANNTRIVYTSDHGESMGRRGQFGKFTHYEESAAVPLIIAGPDVPENRAVNTPVSLVDCYATILDAVGLPLNSDEESLPGKSLWEIARANDDHNRVVFGEYHAVAQRGGSFMVRKGNHKLIHHIGAPPQMFDLAADPDELVDLAASPDHQDILDLLNAELRNICDPNEVDARAKRDQQALVNRYGGKDAVLQRGTFTNSPVPGETPAFHAGNDNG